MVVFLAINKANNHGIHCTEKHYYIFLNKVTSREKYFYPFEKRPATKCGGVKSPWWLTKSIYSGQMREEEKQN